MAEGNGMLINATHNTINPVLNLLFVLKKTDGASLVKKENRARGVFSYQIVSLCRAIYSYGLRLGENFCDLYMLLSHD
jgi:hypothetical protein